tara:strand:- start:243 stop:581 length:339 start_codon:yes stop_codon:yes gene_type:complete
MPLYTFEHPITKEQQDIVLGMNDEKVFTDEEGTEWKRLFHAPNTAIDSDIDPFSSRQFVEKTNTRGTMGDLMSRSQEMSEKRTNKLGYDPVKQKYFKEYSKKRNGVKHHLDR